MIISPPIKQIALIEIPYTAAGSPDGDNAESKLDGERIVNTPADALD